MRILGIVLILMGSIILTLRLFFFQDINKSEHQNVNRLRINSFLLFIVAIFSLSLGITLIIINSISNEPVEDLGYLQFIFGVLLVISGITLIIDKEKIFHKWKLYGFKIPAEPNKYKIHTLLCGVILLIIGLSLLVPLSRFL